jgi:outer membrane protein assembly factor BamB
MPTEETGAPTVRKPLRLWPGVAVAVIVVLARFVAPLINSDWFVIGMLGAFAGIAVILIWWLFFSRAAWIERLGALAVTVVAFFAIRPLLHPSITDGMMGNMFAAYAIPPVLAPAFVAWAVATRHLSDGVRRATMIATIFLACGVWTLIRTDGIMGSTGSLLHWRWTPTHEQQMLAQADDLPAVPSAAELKVAPPPAAASPSPAAPAPPEAAAPAAPTPATVVHREAEWPGFRGPRRDGVVRGVRIETDWTSAPPVEMWRRPVGPGWSSFAVSGDLLYTQEQRGGDEVVSCYRLSTGKPVWRHLDATRFWESNGGAGPRATPTLSNGRAYAFGATGILNVLDAATGAVVWSRNVGSDVNVKVPMWGFSSSPLVVDDEVVVAASSTLAAYDAATGALRWSGSEKGFSYSSPHLATIDGVPQILLLGGEGATSVAPATGAVLWKHAWDGGSIVQPAVTDDGGVLINAIASTGGEGIRRLAIVHASGKWTAEERWTSSGLKPYFNDFVVHKDHAFGFDGSILSCIDLADGARKWKGGRYGNGQLVLLPDQDLLLVISEEGELALVNATPDRFTEVAHVTALNGKTWNHPVIARGVLLVRNDHEMAAYRLKSDKTQSATGK